MKREYQTPKAMMIDFTYNERVTATSDPNSDIGLIGDPNSVGLCQQVSDTKCLAFWSEGYDGTTCRQEPVPWSLRG